MTDTLKPPHFLKKFATLVVNVRYHPFIYGYIHAIFNVHAKKSPTIVLESCFNGPWLVFELQIVYGVVLRRTSVVYWVVVWSGDLAESISCTNGRLSCVTQKCHRFRSDWHPQKWVPYILLLFFTDNSISTVKTWKVFGIYAKAIQLPML